MKEKKMERRLLLKTGAVAGAGMIAAACSPQSDIATANKGCRCKKDLSSIMLRNESFYKGGKFDVEKGKDAILALMEFHGYPIFPETREKLWVSDYNTGQFMKLGLAANMFINNEKDVYMLMDLFLMPGQMLPEHWHLDPKGALPEKHEGWLIRNGLSYVVGEGEDNLKKFPAINIPKCHCKGTTTTKHVTKATPGVFVPLKNPEKSPRHWQFGGPEGAIITEVANVHSNPDVRHSDKAMNDFFLKG